MAEWLNFITLRNVWCVGWFITEEQLWEVLWGVIKCYGYNRGYNRL